MFRILFIVAAVVAVASAGWFDAGTVANQFIVTYNIVPDPMHTFSFYKMPRTLGAAKQDKFTQAFHQSGSDDVGLLEGHVTLWCRDEDYRVCVYFDKKGSVAGIKLSATVSEIEAAKVPLDIAAIPEWRKQMFLAQPVYSASAFFQSQDELLSGGRTMTDDTLTAPNGLYILQTDSSGFETGFLHVPNAEAEATSAGFTEQACFYGMGKHYFQNLAKSGTCEAHRPYFLLFGPKTKQLQGFGFVQYGKVSQGRGWFETPPALVAKKIAPNSPDCMTKWINKYGLFTMHVFFVEKPYYTRC